MAFTPIPVKNEDDPFTNADPGVPLLGIRWDPDTSPVSADGDYHPFTFNSTGRLKVSTMPGNYSATSGTITSATSTVSADVARASNAMITITGTFAGVNATFEVSLDGGATWVTTQAVRTNANTVETTTGSISAAPAYGWELSVNACTNVRVRATAWTSGTATVTILPGSYATEPVPAIQTHAVTQSGAPWGAYLSASTSAVGVTMFRDTAVTATDVTVKTAAGRVYNYYCYNPHTADVWVHLYNALIANVTPGTTAPLYSIYVPAGGTAEREFSVPITFATAISAASTTTLAGATGPATGTVVEIGYI